MNIAQKYNNFIDVYSFSALFMVTENTAWYWISSNTVAIAAGPSAVILPQSVFRYPQYLAPRE
jgi:hypothetical protein